MCGGGGLVFRNAENKPGEHMLEFVTCLATCDLPLSLEWPGFCSADQSGQGFLTRPAH